jgi:sec-independent protein translocase protein TatA
VEFLARQAMARLNWTSSMGGFSIWHWMLFAAIALLLFGGKGKISDIMGDVAKGVKSFKKGLADEDAPDVSTAPSTSPKSLETRAVAAEIRDPHNVN